MLFSDILRLSLRMFKARTLRTFLTMLGMGVGISAIVFLVSLGYGLQDTILQKITTSDALSTLDVSAGTEPDAPSLDETTVETLKNIPNVEIVIPVNELRGQMKVSGITLDSGSLIALPTYFRLEGINVAGSVIKDSAREAVITSGVAKAFGKNPEDLLGESIGLSIFVTRDSGSGEQKIPIEDGFTIVGIAESDENLFYISPDSISGVQLPPATKIKVKGSSTSALPELRNRVQELGLTASSISETIDQANKVFQGIQIALMFFGVIALVVSAIGMFNTMTITLLERTEEIGIMKSIGASPFSISLMFIMEATLMGFLGSLMGIVLGILSCEGINAIFNFIATRFGGQTADLFLSPLWFLMAIIIFGAFVGFLTGIIPAQKAAKTDALEALRYK
jgi:putative ABC transport system permease protein